MTKLSARSGDIDKINGLTLGADDYVTKPFQPLELAARVRPQLRRYTRYNGSSAVTDKDMIDIRGLHIEKNSHECRLNGERLDLTPNKLERVCDNIIRNAVHYSYPDTEIHVTLKKDGAYACAVFANHGDTLSPNQLAKIFDQFYRADPSRSGLTGGAGLGLAISKRIVELHHGTIEAESKDQMIRIQVRLRSDGSLAYRPDLLYEKDWQSHRQKAYVIGRQGRVSISVHICRAGYCTVVCVVGHTRRKGE